MSDENVRRRAFDWLREQVARHDEVLPWSVLQAGFDFNGTRVALVSMPGIFKPRVSELPLSIRTAVDGPYDDRAGSDGRFFYAYRGKEPDHPDNAGLREAMNRRVPLVHFFGLLPGPLSRRLAGIRSRRRSRHADIYYSTRSCIGSRFRRRRIVTGCQPWPRRGTSDGDMLPANCKSASTSVRFANACCAHIVPSVRCAGSATTNCSMPPISCRTAKPDRRRYPTGSRCASCITPHLIRCSWAYDRMAS